MTHLQEKFSSSIFKRLVLSWFDQHGRKDLPWQENITPYRVWISEIMLQQTQVSTVVGYFDRFMKRFPDIESLAAADTDDVMHLWTGLGYYSRARNLHKSAKIIVEKYGSEFPSDLDTLQTLPGIGRSTAGAILAISMDKKAAILDGNVKRVLVRFHAIEGWPGQPAIAKRLWALADHYTPQKRTADYTQAMMDLGALVCVRGKPRCDSCPLVQYCKAHLQKREDQIPFRKPKKSLTTKTIYLLMLCNSKNEILLEKRPPVGIWGGLWSFPECQMDSNLKQWCLKKYGIHAMHLEYWLPFRHTFSHFHLEIHPVKILVNEQMPNIMDSNAIVWYNSHQSNKRGLAAPVKYLLEQLASKAETPL